MIVVYAQYVIRTGGSVAEWLACWTPACRVQIVAAVLGKLFTPIVPLITKQQNW